MIVTKRRIIAGSGSTRAAIFLVQLPMITGSEGAYAVKSLTPESWRSKFTICWGTVAQIKPAAGLMLGARRGTCLRRATYGINERTQR